MSVAALPRTMEALSRRATMLRDSLQKSQGNTDGMVAILGSFDHRLSALEAAMRPTQVPFRSTRSSHSHSAISCRLDFLWEECR
jgi:exocyst complex protein 7